MADRAKYLKNIKRVVIKIGSSSITSLKGGLDIANMKKLTSEASSLAAKGIEVIIVTSGAIAAGLKSLNILKKPEDITQLQAAASIGQVELMRIYSGLFSKNNLKIGQILLTTEDTTRREQYLNIKNTIKNLMSLNIIPIINENDSVATDEIKFGDNDELAALVSVLAEADLLIILSDIDGMYDKDPRVSSDAVLIPDIKKIDKDIEDAAGGVGTTIGSGGMVSKIKAAKICSFSGIGMIIANSREKEVLEKIISAKNIGTFFYPETRKKVKSVKKWIAFGIKPKGNIVIDRGAEEAVVQKGKSILPVGVVKARGRFSRGDTLEVYSVDNRLVAKGISSLSDEEVKKVMGKNEKTILSDHGPGLCSEVIHRDQLVVFKE